MGLVLLLYFLKCNASPSNVTLAWAVFRYWETLDLGEVAATGRATPGRRVKSC